MKDRSAKEILNFDFKMNALEEEHKRAQSPALRRLIEHRQEKLRKELELLEKAEKRVDEEAAKWIRK